MQYVHNTLSICHTATFSKMAHCMCVNSGDNEGASSNILIGVYLCEIPFVLLYRNAKKRAVARVP